MNPFSKTALVLVTSTAALLTSLVAWSHDWHLWPAPLLVPVAVGVILRLDRAVSRDRPNGLNGPTGLAGLDSGPGLPPVQSDHREHSVANIPVPSCAPDYDFLFSATVRWRLLASGGQGRRPVNANPGALAIDAILARVRQVTITELPGESALAQHRLGTVLGVVGPDPSGQVEVWATNVALTLSAEDLQRQRKIADLRKDEAIWEHEREYERSRRTYLSEDVLRSTGSAVVWLLAKKDDAIERTVELIGPLAQLTAAANDAEVPDLFRHLVDQSATATGEDAFDMDELVARLTAEGGFDGRADRSAQPEQESSTTDRVSGLIDSFGLKPNTTKYDFFTRRVADLFAQIERHDAAEEVRTSFKVIDLNAAPPTDFGPAAEAPPADYDDDPEPDDYE